MSNLRREQFWRQAPKQLHAVVTTAAHGDRRRAVDLLTGDEAALKRLMGSLWERLDMDKRLTAACLKAQVLQML